MNEGIYEYLKTLAASWNSEDRELIQDMIKSAADYVKAVVIMESVTHNIEGLEGAAYREAAESADRTRKFAHDGLITAVNIMNRLCDIYKSERVYTGSENRREYGDFAMKLTSEIFENRRSNRQ
jgi:hypothetical protein